MDKVINLVRNIGDDDDVPFMVSWTSLCVFVCLPFLSWLQVSAVVLCLALACLALPCLAQ